ncbi:MAG: TonB-dependent receptor [Phycisphaerae bacterium]|nr:TonB-dependent receptor [Saprospiraceae bacterium]
MRKYILAAFSLLAIPIFAQNNFSGTITDQATGDPLVGVTVVLTDLKRSAATDEFGQFQLKNLPVGNFLVEVRYVGYQTQTERVPVNGDTKLNFRLKDAVTEISEVVVTGTTHATELRKHPIAVATIDNLSLTRVTSTNLIDAIAKKPGLSQITTGAGISKPVIRGLGYNRIITLYNGLRQEGQQWGDEHGIEIDEFSVDRVEVLKGPGSLIYGSDALAGVVNFLTPNPLPNGKIAGSAVLNYQTNNDLLATSLSNAGNIGGLNWLLRGSAKEAANYQNRYDGRVWNSGFQERNLNGYVGWNKNWGYSHFNFSTFNQKIGLVEGERDSLGRFIQLVALNDSTVAEIPVLGADLKGYGLHIPQQDIGHARLSNTTSLFFGKYNLEFSLGFQQNTRKEFGNPLDKQAAELEFQLNTWNYDTKLIFPENHGWRSTIGINGMAQTNRNKGDEALVPAYNLFDVGGYALAEREFGKLNLTGGLRYDHRNLQARALYLDTVGALTEMPTENVKFSAFNTNYSGVTGSIGAAYNFDQRFTAKLNLARGFRAPNISESGSNGRHEGTIRYEIGDPKLKPEYSLQTDLGLIFNSHHVTTELSLFYNKMDDYIFAKKLLSTSGSDSIIDPADPVPTFKFVQGNAYLVGGEITLDLHPHPLDWLHIENALSWVKGIQQGQPDSTRFLPFIPAMRLRSELRGDFNKVGRNIRNGFFFLEGSYTFDQNHYYSAFGTETATPGYFLLNAGFGGSVSSKKGKEFCKVYVIADNLLDRGYQSHLSRLKYAPTNLATGRQGVFNMGRNLSLKVLVPLDFK